MKIKKLVQKEVLDISCYEVKTITGQKSDENLIKLNLNENFAMPGDFVQKLLLDASQTVDVRAYPPPRGCLAINAISEFLGLESSQVAVANGADEIMDLLMKVFIRKGSKIMVAEPTFPMYTFFAELYGGKKVTTMLNSDFSLNVDSILKKADKETRLLFVCSPNNPTGNQFKETDIKCLLEEFKGIVVVDEAYVDFASGTAINWIQEYDNLAILRSFSKAFGLAGLRLGYLAASKHIVKYVQRVVGPFNVNSVTQETIRLALQNWSYFKEKLDLVIKEREWLMKNLQQIDGVTPYPSDANFILFKVTEDKLSSETLTKRIETKNVLVKDRGHLPLLDNCIRVTVGTRDMNQKFVSALKLSLEE
ncbi:MAG: histidinol-phosphate transaminase [Candidatus Bathyarchaeota archaeon]|nr:MAG: histidinol-phosphate transaminase [Candidatus Bathyarchaeota archaeon]